ncbi:tryptophan synthase subunit alpha [Patescibacteria group bacterium]|nr:tryptophan synthase subunit alpha [Patescibacteria group bacterium]
MDKIVRQFAKIKQEERIGLMTHVVIGYPSMKETEKIVLAMVEAGVDFIELQMPFSDPLADGPAIMQANQRALQNGIGMLDNLALMKKLSSQVNIPLFFMGYYNTVYNYGGERFCQAAARAGASGLIIPDMPREEEKREGFYAASRKNGLANIIVVSPTTTADRLKKISREVKGFVYCMARSGVTGTRTDFSKNLPKYLGRVRKYVKVPLGVGFGISQGADIKKLLGVAEVAIVGSAVINLLGKSSSVRRISAVNKFIKTLVKASFYGNS